MIGLYSQGSLVFNIVFPKNLFEWQVLSISVNNSLILRQFNITKQSMYIQEEFPG